MRRLDHHEAVDLAAASRFAWETNPGRSISCVLVVRPSSRSSARSRRRLPKNGSASRARSRCRNTSGAGRLRTSGSARRSTFCSISVLDVGVEHIAKCSSSSVSSTQPRAGSSRPRKMLGVGPFAAARGYDQLRKPAPARPPQRRAPNGCRSSTTSAARDRTSRALARVRRSQRATFPPYVRNTANA